MSQLLYHLHIVLHAFLDALGFYLVANLFEVDDLLHQVVLNLTDSYVCLFLRCHEEVGRIEAIFFECGQTVECNGVHLLDGVNLIVPESYSQYYLAIGHGNVYSIALYAEVSSLQVKVVSYI